MDMRFTSDHRKLKEIINLLTEKECSCVVSKDGTVRCFYERGVRDLYALLTNEPEFLEGAYIADKVVGKAAASLMILGKIAGLYARTISQHAVSLLHYNAIPVKYGTSVPHIINRSKTDWCPLEKRCLPLQTPEECFESIRDFITNTN